MELAKKFSQQKSSGMVRVLYNPINMSEEKITRSEALAAFYELREQAKNVPEMSLEEINTEIQSVRNEKKLKNVIICGN